MKMTVDISPVLARRIIQLYLQGAPNEESQQKTFGSNGAMFTITDTGVDIATMDGVSTLPAIVYAIANTLTHSGGKVRL